MKVEFAVQNPMGAFTNPELNLPDVEGPQTRKGHGRQTKCYDMPHKSVGIHVLWVFMFQKQLSPIDCLNIQ